MSNDRDVRRAKTPPAGVRAQTARPLTSVQVHPVEVHEETSQSYDDPDERAAWRAEQQLERRVEKVEKKVDDIGENFTEFKIQMAGMKSSIDTWVDLQKGERDSKAQERKDRRETIRAFFKVMVPLVTAIGVAIGVYYAAKNNTYHPPAPITPPAQIAPGSGG